MGWLKAKWQSFTEKVKGIIGPFVMFTVIWLIFCVASILATIKVASSLEDRLLGQIRDIVRQELRNDRR